MLKPTTSMFVLSLVASAALLSACGKSGDQPAQSAATKTVEAIAEKSIKQSGAQEASVKIDNQSFKADVTNADGTKTSIDIGNSPVTQADLGIEIYPGAAQTPGMQSRIQSGKDLTVSASFTTADTPDKVATFYREKLKTLSAGKNMTDVKNNEETQMIVSDPNGQGMTSVTIVPKEQGAQFSFMVSRRGQ